MTDRQHHEEADENVGQIAGAGAREARFASFRDTFKIITFAMCVGLIYPEPATDRRRLVCIGITMLTVAPFSGMILLDTYNSWLRRDIINVIRHCTVVGPFLGGFSKMFIMFYKRADGKRLIDEMDRDYAAYNRLPGSYRRIADESVRNSVVYSERCWAVTVIACVMTFPLMSTIANIYNSLFVDIPTRHFVHDVDRPFAYSRDERFATPYFEIMYGYMLYCSALYVINFTGYDGFFGVCVNHACLKVRLCCAAFEDAMRGRGEREIDDRLVEVIADQNRMFQFVDLIQKTFNIWLGLILIATMIQICNCMYHITEGYELDLRYIIFILGTVVHIYLPCRYSAKLKYEAARAATALYRGGWERVRAGHVRRAVSFMIARGQTPLEITAFNMLAFDMELFVSILQTSYSMYTLLRS